MISFVSLKENSNITKKMSKLYAEAFPRNERAPFFLLAEKAKKEGADLFQIEDDGKDIGLLFTLYDKDIVYLFYLAINPEFRGQGYGTTVLQLIQEKYKDKRIVLNFEEVDEKYKNYKQRLNRKNFYLRNGFKDSNIKTKEFSVIYDMVYYNNNITYNEYANLMKSFLGKFIFKMIGFKEVK